MAPRTEGEEDEMTGVAVTLESLEQAGYVEFFSTGEAAAGEYHCGECGYGVVVSRELPRCPMCSGTVWERSAWSPFTRRTDLSQ